MDKQNQIFDEYGNYAFPTDIKQKGVNTVSSCAGKNNHSVEVNDLVVSTNYKGVKMDKQMIEEIEKDIAVRMAMAKGVIGSMNNGVEGWLAKYLIEKGWAKIPEGAVVLTREEYQKYLAFKIIEPQIRGCLDREEKLEKQVRELDKELNLAKSVLSYDDERPLEKWAKHLRKETAEKFAEMAKERAEEMATPSCYVYMVYVDDIDEICKEITEGKKDGT